MPEGGKTGVKLSRLHNRGFCATIVAALGAFSGSCQPLTCSYSPLVVQNMCVVCCDSLRIRGLSCEQGKIARLSIIQVNTAIIELSMMVRTNTDDILRYVRAVMWRAQRPYVMGFSIDGSIAQHNCLPADLALVLVQ